LRDGWELAEVRLRGRLDYLLDDITESQPLALILGHLE
jgi:hypothetical protein